MFRMPEIIVIKQGRGHPKNFTNLYRHSREIFVFTKLYDFEVLSATVEFNELFFFQKEWQQEAHFDYCQRPFQAGSTAHCKTVKQWNTHPYSFDMHKTSNFMAKTNTEPYKSTTAEACLPGF